jgi:hypothetical protein
VLLYIAFCCLLGKFIAGFMIGAAAFGVASFPVLPVMLELLTRKFENIPFHVTNTVMFVTSQLFSVIMQTILGRVMDSFPADGGVIAVVSIIWMITCTLFFIKDIDNHVEL